MSFKVYERFRDGKKRYWAIKSTGNNEVVTRWSRPGSERLAMESIRTADMQDIIRKKESEGNVYIGEFDISDDGRLISASNSFKTSNVTNNITWEFQKSFEVTDNDLQEAFTRLGIKINFGNSNIVIDTDGTLVKKISIGSWSVGFDDKCNLNLNDPVVHGVIEDDADIEIVLFLIALRLEITSESWQRGISIILPNDDSVGDKIKGEEGLLSFFKTDFETIRPSAVALGLIIDRQVKFKQTANSDWF